jgi:hypothetical protein
MFGEKAESRCSRAKASGGIRFIKKCEPKMTLKGGLTACEHSELSIISRRYRAKFSRDVAECKE